MASSLVNEFWNVPPVRGEVLTSDADWVVVIDPTMTTARRVRHLIDQHGVQHVAFRPDVAESLDVRGRAPRDLAELEAILAGANEAWEDWELAFYLPHDAADALLAEPVPERIRVLGQHDAAAFVAFQALSSAEDLDEAYVELDHWLALGTWAAAGEGEANVTDGDGRAEELIVAAASVYPWDQSRLADIGIITAPQFRGKGLASELVRAAAAETLRRGYEPQYRCQATHLASRATAAAAGFEQWCRWRVVVGGERT